MHGQRFDFSFFTFANMSVLIGSLYCASSLLLGFEENFLIDVTIEAAVLFFICALCTLFIMIFRFRGVDTKSFSALLDVAPLILFVFALYAAGSFQDWMIILLAALICYAFLDYIIEPEIADD